MIKRARIAIGVVVMLAVPLAARADERFFGTGMTGVTTHTVTNSTVAGTGGVAITKHFDVFGEIGRLTNVLPRTEYNTILANGNAIAATQNAAATVVGNYPAMYGLGGVRANAVVHGRISSFAEAGVGTAHLKNQLAVTDGLQNLTTASLTTPMTLATSLHARMVVAGVGLSFNVDPKAAFELGYRYDTIATSAPRITIGSVYGALRLRF
jgi:hypothetical protein